MLTLPIAALRITMRWFRMVRLASSVLYTRLLATLDPANEKKSSQQSVPALTRLHTCHGVRSRLAMMIRTAA